MRGEPVLKNVWVFNAYRFQFKFISVLGLL